MRYLSDPALYQIQHPWHWITSGQNASGLAAAATCIAAFSATVAGIYAIRAYRATVLLVNAKVILGEHITELETNDKPPRVYGRHARPTTG